MAFLALDTIRANVPLCRLMDRHINVRLPEPVETALRIVAVTQRKPIRQVIEEALRRDPRIKARIVEKENARG